MVVDDSPIVLELVQGILSDGGYEVVTVTSPFGFSSHLRREKPDLVLVDVGMPALQGDKLVEIAQRNESHRCPVVLYSDRSEAELLRLVRSSGATGYIRKSGQAAELL